MLGEHLAGPPDEPRGGLIAGRGDQVDVVDHLFSREAAARPRLVLELGLQQLGHEVVGGVLGPPVDVVRERCRPDQRRSCRRSRAWCLLRAAGPRRCGRGWPPGPARGCRAACRSCASASARRGRDEVEAAGPDQRIERSGAELAHLGLDGVHPAGREHPRQQARDAGHGSGGSSKMIEPTGMSMPALDDLEHRAPGRAVGAPIDRCPLDVFEPAQGVEVVALVVVERPLVAQPLPHRVRIRVDLEVVGVVVDVGVVDVSVG